MSPLDVTALDARRSEVCAGTGAHCTLHDAASQSASLREANETISILRATIFELEQQLCQFQTARQTILQPETESLQNDDIPAASPSPPLYDNLSLLFTGLQNVSLTRRNVEPLIVQVCRETFQMQSVPSFTVVKVFRQTANQRVLGQPQSVGALVRFRSEVEVRAILAAKGQYLSADSPISIDRNRSSQQRREQIALRATRRRARNDCNAQSPHPVTITATDSSLNPYAPEFVPASMSQAPGACSPPTDVACDPTLQASVTSAAAAGEEQH